MAKRLLRLGVTALVAWITVVGYLDMVSNLEVKMDMHVGVRGRGEAAVRGSLVGR